MNDLIKTFKKTDGSIAVDGRDLHDFLEVETPYRIWIQRMIGYGFTENLDFTSFEQKSTKPNGGRPQVDHALTLDMAKELSMIQRTEKGKQARRYFISMEKQAKQAVLPKTPMETLKLMFQATEETDKKVTKVEHRVTDLEDNQSLAPGQYNYISTCVRKAVRRYVAAHHLVLNRKQRGQLFRDINGGLNQVTGIRTRTQLRQKDFDKADEYISNWIPSTATVQIIKELSQPVATEQEA